MRDADEQRAVGGGRIKHFHVIDASLRIALTKSERIGEYALQLVKTG
jgi:hypothetical protein